MHEFSDVYGILRHFTTLRCFLFKYSVKGIVRFADQKCWLCWALKASDGHVWDWFSIFKTLTCCAYENNKQNRKTSSKTCIYVSSITLYNLTNLEVRSGASLQSAWCSLVSLWEVPSLHGQRCRQGRWNVKSVVLKHLGNDIGRCREWVLPGPALSSRPPAFWYRRWATIQDVQGMQENTTIYHHQ